MYCSKCGAQLPDDAKFCESCGASTSDEQNISDFPNDGFNAEVSVTKKTPKIVFTVILAAVLVVAFAFMAKAQIMKTFMPKTYVEYTMLNTANKIEKEVSDFQEKIFGFEIDENSNFTTSLDISIDDSDVDINSTLAYLGSKNKLSFDISAECDGESVDANLFWDNKKIGVAVPKLIDDKYITVDAKNFGKQVYDSDFDDVRDIIDKDADISFENIFKNRFDIEKYSKMNKKLKKEFSALVKSGEITEKEKTEVEIDGKTKKVSSVEIRFGGNDIRDCILNCIDILRDDEEFANASSMIKTEASLDDILDEVRDEIKDIDFDEDIEIKFLTYKDYLVGIEFEVDDADTMVKFNFNSIKTMLDLWEIEIENGREEFVISSEGNIVPVKNVIDYSIEAKDDYSKYKILLSADLNDGEYKLKVYEDGDEEFSVKGECTNKGGFAISYKNDDIRAELTISKGAKFNKISGMEDYMIFEHSEDEIQDDFEEYQDNFEDLSGILSQNF